MGDMNLSDFYCTRCGQKSIPIWRKAGRSREPGHLKKLWCLNCQDEVNHVEVRPFGKYNYEDFLLEFENNNFNEDGTRKMEYKKFKGVMNNALRRNV